MDAPVKSYCEAVQRVSIDPLHKQYHDGEYGFPIYDDDKLFARLVLEINQAGLSWLTILKKKENFHRAFDNFSIEKVSRYGAKQFQRLMNDETIIRNRLKIEATIENAKRIKAIQKKFGSFRAWLDHHHPKSKDEWVKVFKAAFKFTGGEIVNEFLMSTGYLRGAHDESCPVYKKVLKKNPAWFQELSYLKSR